MSKLYGLVDRWLFVSRNGLKMQFLGVVGFKSSTLTVYCLSSWIVHQQRKTYSNFCVLCWLSHPSWFQGPKDIPPSFWPQVTNHDVKSKISKKWFLRLLLFYQICNFGRFWWIFLNIKPTFNTYQNLCMTFTDILGFLLNFQHHDKVV